MRLHDFRRSHGEWAPVVPSANCAQKNHCAKKQFLRALFTLLVMTPLCNGQAGRPIDVTDEAWTLLESTWSSGNHLQKEEVLGSLARVRSPRATEIFRKALRDAPLFAARAANLASEERVSELRTEIAARLKGERDTHARIELIGCLRKLRTGTAADLVMPFAMREEAPLNGVAFGVLSDLGAVAVPVLGRILKEGCSTCKETAAYLLTQTDSGGASPELRGALDEPSVRVRTLAAMALTRSGDRSGSAVLRAALETHDFSVRVWASLALYSLGDSQYQESLLKLIEGAEPEQRFFAIREVLRRGSPPLRGLVVSIAEKDSFPTVRSLVFTTIPGAEKNHPMLLKLLRDSDPQVRLLAAERTVGGEERGEADNVLRERFHSGVYSDEERVLAILSKVGIATQVERDIVAAALQSESSTVQAAAANAIKTLGNQVIPELVPLLGSSDVFLSATAASALVDISPSDAAPILERGMRSSKGHVKIICAGYLLHALESQ
jgi:HEAT repeat protein